MALGLIHDPTVDSLMQAAELLDSIPGPIRVSGRAGFLRIRYLKAWPATAPVLLRCALSPLSSLSSFDNPLRTFPGTFLYGGPSQYQYLTNFMGKRFLESLQYWAMTNQRNLTHELIPIAPNGYAGAPAWPRTSWSWEWVKETGPMVEHTLVMTTPTHGEWRTV